MSTREAIEGIRLPQTEEWISAHTHELTPPFEWTRLTGGTSNLTYAIRDARGRRAVVRRPPTGKLLPKAHDMIREHKILSGLSATAVPVAHPYVLCRDPEVTGAPFYVMTFCEGVSVSKPDGTLLDLPAAARARVGASAIEALASLHTVAPEDVGLADLGRAEGYVARQLKRWFDSFQRSKESAAIELPAIEEAFELLSARIPEQGPARICHGDYGLHNLLVSDAGEVVAITDWEIGTLGDPLADVTYFLRGWGEDGISSKQAFLDARRGEGYSTRRALLAMYEGRTGRRIDDLWYYVAFNTFKTCCIVQGVYARFRGGVRGTQGVDLDALRKRVLLLAHATTSALEQL